MAPKDGGNPTQGDSPIWNQGWQGYGRIWNLGIGNNFQDGVWKLRIQGTITLLATLYCFMRYTIENPRKIRIPVSILF